MKKTDFFCIYFADEQTKLDDIDATNAITEQTTTMPDQTTLLPNEAEMFALEPIDVTSMGKIMINHI